MKYIVEVSYYHSQNGYSHTEIMDSGTTRREFTVKEWNNGLDEPFEETRGSWVVIDVQIFADDADPMFDTPFCVDSLVI